MKGKGLNEKVKDDMLTDKRSNTAISGERIARLIADLESHERFWYYLARFQISGGYRR